METNQCKHSTKNSARVYILCLWLFFAIAKTCLMLIIILLTETIINKQHRFCEHPSSFLLHSRQPQSNNNFLIIIVTAANMHVRCILLDSSRAHHLIQSNTFFYVHTVESYTLCATSFALFIELRCVNANETAKKKQNKTNRKLIKRQITTDYRFDKCHRCAMRVEFVPNKHATSLLSIGFGFQVVETVRWR